MYGNYQATEEFRIKEMVGLGKFTIQRKFIDYKLPENEINFFDRICFLISEENKDKIIWYDLNMGGYFGGMKYHTQYFDTLEEINKILERFKTVKAEILYH